jgi:hypothetical protein
MDIMLWILPEMESHRHSRDIGANELDKQK